MPVEGAVEGWMTEVEAEMRRTLHVITKEAVFYYAKKARRPWILENLGMCALVGTQIWWTWEVEDVFRRVRDGNKLAMKQFLKKNTAQLLELIDMVRDEGGRGVRRSFSLSFSLSHARALRLFAAVCRPEGPCGVGAAKSAGFAAVHGACLHRASHPGYPNPPSTQGTRRLRCRSDQTFKTCDLWPASFGAKFVSELSSYAARPRRLPRQQNETNGAWTRAHASALRTRVPRREQVPASERASE